ncbi:uncharacterized protein LOC108734791 [Agrilus planipennis]|uniref:Mediator of DNA damage checkpoint protein 1 n=1 Tax=Agrilus planipennis TaxID=224129 RepID=A0A1W4WDE6_AGRPL|nr:uncharacterized protein LOC108734791 [Agrilus planipennis]
MTEGRERVGYLRVSGHNYPVFKGLNIIGRNKLATVIMKSPTISHQHSMIIVVEKGKYFLSDLNSANGTFLNEEKLTPLLLYEIPNMCKMKFARISAIFIECPGRIGSSTFRREQFSQATQNTENLFMTATQKLDVIEEVSIHDLATQPIDDLIIRTMNTTEKTNITKTQLSNEIHELPTQILCPDVAMEVSVQDVQIQVNTTLTNQTNLEEDMVNVISDECIDDSVLPTISFHNTSDLNKSNNYTQNKQVNDHVPSKIKNTSSQTASYDSDYKKKLNKSNSTTIDEIESNRNIPTDANNLQHKVESKTEHLEKGSQTPNVSQGNSSQSQIHVSQIKRKVRKRISSDSDTPSSLDILSNPASPVPQLKTKKRNPLSSDESGGDSGTGVVLPNKVGPRKKLVKRRISSENSSSDTDIERLSPNKILSKKIKSRAVSRKLESNSDTDIEKEPGNRHKVAHNKENSNIKTTMNQSQNTINSQCMENSFKLALSNTMDALNTDSESDYVFGNPTQNVSGSQTDSSKQMKTNVENPSDTEMLEEDIDIFMQPTQRSVLPKSTKNATVEDSNKRSKKMNRNDDSGSETDDDLLAQKSQEINNSKTTKKSNSQNQTTNEPCETENVKVRTNCLNEKSKIHENEESSVSSLQNFNIAKEIQKLKNMDNIFLASIRDLKNAEAALNDEHKFQSQKQSQSVKDAKTQAKVIDLCDNEDDIFLQPTQKFAASTSVTINTFGSKIPSQDDEDDIYLEPTQKFKIPYKNQPYKNELTQNEDDDVYLQPTQKFATSCIPMNDKLFNRKESQNEDDAIFLQPTQKLQNKESSQDEEDDDIYLQPTQKFSLPLPAIIESSDANEFSQNENDLQPTQKFLAPRKSKLGYLECSENDNYGNDVCLQSSQKLSVPSKSENDVSSDIPKRCAENSKASLPSVESQLEVMFSSQNISADNDRPSNPLANVLDEEQSQTNEEQNSEEIKQTSSYSKRSDVNTDEKENLSSVEKLRQKSVIDRKTASLQTIDDRTDAATASEIRNFVDRGVGNLQTRQPELNVYSATVASISPSQRLRRRASSNRSVSVPVAKLSSKTKGPSCVEVSLENKRTILKPHSLTVCDALTSGKRTRKTALVKDDDSDNQADIKDELIEKRVTRRTTSEYTIARKKKSMHLDSFKPNTSIPVSEIADEDFLNMPKSSSSRRTEKSEASTSKRAPETLSPPVTPQKRKKTVKVSPANDSMLFSTSNQSKFEKSNVESRLMDITPERRNQRTKVVFTMLDSPQLSLIVRQCGGIVVDTVEAATVLVTTSIKRTQKLLTAVGLGKPVCSVKWLEDSKVARNFLDPWDYILTDDEAQQKWNFSLMESLNRSNKKKLLEEYVFQLCVTTATDVLKSAIEACGGKCISRAPAKTDKKFIVVSSPDNRNKYKKFLQKVPPVPVVTPEAIFHGVLVQKFEVAPFLLS